MKFLIDKQKALKKWKPVLEYLNVTDEEKKNWIIEDCFDCNWFNETDEERLERERTERRIQREKKIERLFKKDNI